MIHICLLFFLLKKFNLAVIGGNGSKVFFLGVFINRIREGEGIEMNELFF